ncbi:MAG: HAD family hydrolase [Chloroflexota bacterium]
MSLDKIKFISFDLWGTLIWGGNPEYRQGKLAIFQKYLETEATLGTIRRFAAKADNYFNILSEEEGIDYSFRARIGWIHERVDSRIPTLSHEIFEQIEAALGKLIALHPPFLIEKDLPQTLQLLKESGYQLGVISNSGTITGKNMRRALKVLGLVDFFDLLVFSEEVRIAKPHPGMFNYIITKMELAPSELLHIGDNLRADVGGAIGAGCRTLHYSSASSSEVPSLNLIKYLPLKLKEDKI